MHEQIITQDLISRAKEQGSVKSITVEVGDLAHLPAEDLEKALKEVVEWEITVLRKKATVECGCGYKGEPKIIQRLHDTTVFECPKCQEIPQVIDGEEIKLKEVTLE